MNRPAEAFPLWEYLVEEMAARDWKAADVCRGSYLSETRLLEILAGSRVGLREAEMLGMAFGVSAAMLLNLQMAYKRWREANP